MRTNFIVNCFYSQKSKHINQESTLNYYRWTRRQGKSPNLQKVGILAQTDGEKKDGKEKAEEESLDAVDEPGEDPAQPPRDVLHQRVHLPVKDEG